MNKYGYILATASISMISSPVVADENNQDYINLSTNVGVSSQAEVLKELVDKNPIDYKNPINKSCIAKGFDVVRSCPEIGNCIPDYCPENNLFMRCTCFCSLNECSEEGYIYQQCGRYQTEEDCPISPGNGYVKCFDMPDFQKCIIDGYLEIDTICTGYKKADNCPHDKSYIRCVDMNDEEKCKSDGYNISICKDGEMPVNKCPFGDEELYLSCDKFVCSPDYVTECKEGYIKDKLDICRDDSGVKYKCLKK